MKRLLPGRFILFALLLASCGTPQISESEAAQQTKARAVELDLYVQRTLQAQSDRERFIQQTLLASTPSSVNLTPLPILDFAAPTQTPIKNTPFVTATIDFSTPIEPNQQFNEEDFNQWLKTAKILVYEDMTARLETFRYVRTTLDEMGLPYKDDGSAIGWFYDDLDSGPEEGDQWDLIIFALEDKKGVKANFYDLAIEAVDNGTSIIFEAWNLNRPIQAAPAISFPGAGWYMRKIWSGIPPTSALLFPIARTHPILNMPNTNLTFGSPTNQWWDPSGQVAYDVGDLIGLSTTGDAVLLLGTGVGSEITHGTSAVCVEGRIIFQTFSSHMLSFESMEPLWENYIYNALRTRFETVKLTYKD